MVPLLAKVVKSSTSQCKVSVQTFGRQLIYSNILPCCILFRNCAHLMRQRKFCMQHMAKPMDMNLKKSNNILESSLRNKQLEIHLILFKCLLFLSFVTMMLDMLNCTPFLELFVCLSLSSYIKTLKLRNYRCDSKFQCICSIYIHR